MITPRRRAARARGFTLMEVMTALTITAVVATLAASALHAGIDVRERVQTHRETVDAEARAVSWIGSMLRHPPPATAVDEPLLTVTHAGGGNNRLDGLTFLSQGVEMPLGTGPVWRVTLLMQEDGLHIRALPVSATSNRVPLETVLSHIGGLSVDVIDANGGPGNSAVWRGDWPVLRTMPRAVRLRLATRDGRTREPLVFSVAPLAGAGN